MMAQRTVIQQLVEFLAVPITSGLLSKGQNIMYATRLVRLAFFGILVVFSVAVPAFAQNASDDQFGPVVRAYLGYLRNEQEVVDDRASRHEINPSYYRRNSNRIHALRATAVRIARESQNDYLPELEAVTGDELGLLFERPPHSQSLRVGEVVQTTFRYLGSVRSGDLFYVFARLDPYEQADLMQSQKGLIQAASGTMVSNPISGQKTSMRARRVSNP